MKIKIAAAARREILAARLNWRARHPQFHTVFSDELKRALAAMAEHPEIGRRAAPDETIRDGRVYVLRESGYIMLYRIVRNSWITVARLKIGRKLKKLA